MRTKNRRVIKWLNRVRAEQMEGRAYMPNVGVLLDHEPSMYRRHSRIIFDSELQAVRRYKGAISKVKP